MFSFVSLRMKRKEAKLIKLNQTETLVWKQEKSTMKNTEYTAETGNWKADMKVWEMYLNICCLTSLHPQLVHRKRQKEKENYDPVAIAAVSWSVGCECVCSMTLHNASRHKRRSIVRKSCHVLMLNHCLLESWLCSMSLCLGALCTL